MAEAAPGSKNRNSSHGLRRERTRVEVSIDAGILDTFDEFVPNGSRSRAISVLMAEFNNLCLSLEDPNALVGAILRRKISFAEILRQSFELDD